MPSETARCDGVPTYRTKQLIVVASDLVLHAVRGDGRPPVAVASELVETSVLPGCYRARYDEGFLEIFHNVVELTRNALVSDLPHVSATAGVLAALAILRAAHAIAARGGNGHDARAAAIDPELRGQLAHDGVGLRAELSELEGAWLEDTDALALFELPAGEDPTGGLAVALSERERALLRFENWLVPFGNPPRPRISEDGRAWPDEP